MVHVHTSVFQDKNPIVRGFEVQCCPRIKTETLPIAVFLNMSSGDLQLAMVYQDYMLFPHLTVEENIRFGLKVEPIPETEADCRVSNFADLLDISDILHRYPHAQWW